LAKLKSEPKTQTERIAAVSPKYAALIEKNAVLTERYDAIIEEANGPRGRVDGTVSVTTGDVTYHPVPLAEQFRRSLISWVSQLPRVRPKPVVRSAAAVALVGNDLLSPQSEEEINPPAPQPSWSGQDRLAALGAEAETISDALKLIAPELAKGRRDYSKLVAAQRGSEYQEIVEKMVDAAKVLGGAILAHYAFIEAQRQNGVAYSNFRPLNLERFENIDEPYSPLLKLILDAVEKKHVGADRLPSWTMPAPIQYFSGGN
jgi:hypothetical protein